MNADGSEKTQITNSDKASTQPAWSPDGSQIVFSSTRDGDVKLFVMNADGSDPIRLVKASIGGDFQADWGRTAEAIPTVSPTPTPGEAGVL